MENPENYCNKVVQRMIKSYENTGDKDEVIGICKEVYFLNVFDELPNEYFKKISSAFRKIVFNR
ncbi:hypothetical protein [Clostridium beijerinckii]|uniref:hypothetical protein n=1 Tax=Clostridium beijerinckii TaxID=1520 RepID=UPI0002EA0C4D|nr:hypothetical protein [Clostridium beijerinckii]